MGSFEVNGFLSEDLVEYRNHIKERFSDLYGEALRVNEYAQQLQYKPVIHKENPDELVAAILYARTISTYQALILVSERGMLQQVKMLLRCMLESLFPLVAISENEGYSKKLISAEEIERLKALNKLIRYKERNGEKDKDLEDAKGLAATVKQNIEKNGIKKIKVEDSAKKAKLFDWYDTAYSLLSNTIHSSMRSLEEHLHIDADNNIEALKNEPETEGLDQLYRIAIESMLYAVKAIGRLFKIEVEEFVEEASKNIRRYSQNNRLIE